MVDEAVEGLPLRFRKKLENVEIGIEEGPSSRFPHKGNLLGLYQGIPRTRRGVWYANVLPDKITIFKGSIESQASTEKELKELIQKVVMHEIGHHFGMSESQLRRLEIKECSTYEAE